MKQKWLTCEEEDIIKLSWKTKNQYLADANC